jgi:structural maintenance of chromosome 1
MTLPQSSVQMELVRVLPQPTTDRVGKSNLMDAISFVLGIKSSQLRSSQLRDLIYRGRILKESNGLNGREDDDEEDDEPTQTQTLRTNGEEEERGPRRAWVMAVYEEDNGKEIRYKRTFDRAGFA